MSIEDKRFMKIANESIVLENGHYQLDLPFRKENTVMPNNKVIAEQRLANLKRKLKKNEHFQSEYTDFLSDVIDNGYAEVVPQEQLERKDGRVWYIPHHGVYHPQKSCV